MYCIIEFLYIFYMLYIIINIRFTQHHRRTTSYYNVVIFCSRNHALISILCNITIHSIPKYSLRSLKMHSIFPYHHPPLNRNCSNLFIPIIQIISSRIQSRIPIRRYYGIIRLHPYCLQIQPQSIIYDEIQ